MRVRAAWMLVVLILVAELGPADAVAAPADGGQAAASQGLVDRAITGFVGAGGRVGQVLARAGESLPDRLRGWLGLGGSNDQASAAQAAPRPDHQPKARPLKFKRVKELTGKRTARAKVFELEDGRVEAELSAVPVHYRDATGAWRPIDTRIEPADRPGFAFGAVENSFGSLFGARSDRLLRFEQDGRQVTVGLPGAPRALAPRVAGSQITYPDALGAGVDLVYQVTPEGSASRSCSRAAP